MHRALPSAIDLRQPGYAARVGQHVPVELGVVRDNGASGQESSEHAVDLLESRLIAKHIAMQAMHSGCLRLRGRARAHDGVEEGLPPIVDDRRLHDFGLRTQAGRLDVDDPASRHAASGDGPRSSPLPRWRRASVFSSTSLLAT